MITSIPISDDLSLSVFWKADKPNLMQYLTDAEVYRNTMRIPKVYTETDADEWLAITAADMEKHDMINNWAIRNRNGDLIGGVGCFLKTGKDGHSDEIGYWLAAPYRGKGIMTTVVKAYSDWLFANRPLVRLEAYVFSHNPASVRVLEKAGFEKEGYLRKLHVKDGAYVDAVLLSRVKG